MGFNAADTRTLMAMARAWRQQPVNQRKQPLDDPFDAEEGHQAPEVYVAKPQSGSGIPALAGTTPGSGPCDIYKVATTGDLEAITGLERTVYNLSGSVIGQEFTTVKRDKFGKWFIPKAETVAGISRFAWSWVGGAAAFNIAGQADTDEIDSDTGYNLDTTNERLVIEETGFYWWSFNANYTKDFSVGSQPDGERTRILFTTSANEMTWKTLNIAYPPYVAASGFNVVTAQVHTITGMLFVSVADQWIGVDETAVTSIPNDLTGDEQLVIYATIMKIG